MSLYRLSSPWVRTGLCLTVAFQFLIATDSWATPPRVRVSKKIACVPETADCGNLPATEYRKIKTGFTGSTQLPAFCYQITISNATTSVVNGIRVSDNQLDLSGCGFPTSLAAGATATCYILAEHQSSVTNTAKVVGKIVGTTLVTTNTSTAVANVLPASIECVKSVSSPDDTDGNPDDDKVTLPADGLSHSLTYSVLVSNTGESALRRVAINDPALKALGCATPPRFPLAIGASTNITLCTVEVDCTLLPVTNEITVTGEVRPLMGQCGRDINGDAIAVSSTCTATARCGGQGDDDDDDDDDDDNGDDDDDDDDGDDDDDDHNGDDDDDHNGDDDGDDDDDDHNGDDEDDDDHKS